MIKKGYNTTTNKKIDEIIELCKNVEKLTGYTTSFDNTIPNKYTLTIGIVSREFTTYKDVKNVLWLIIMSR